ncbi:MAG TPA: biosynthetic peptidoglycan transglycosylase, partial [Candidatus Limnocylindrales bacterium]
MQTSLSRRQRRRRSADRRRPRGSGAATVAVIALPLLLFTTLLLLGAAGATASVAAYSYLSKDLEDPKAALDKITFTAQTKVYDRTGAVLLASLGDDRREVVTFDQIPPVLIDATTSVEDKTFWDNSGFDPAGFIAAAIDTISGRDRGGSTITQQLVRARLLPKSAFTGSVYERKAKEIIQSIRLTQAYPGAEGKKAIMEKYLNQNFYGNRSYGVAAAARSYFGKELKDLTLAEAALLAGIPQSPTKF